MNIFVTQSHIDRARKLYEDPNVFKCGSCPIALAVQEKLKPDYEAIMSNVLKIRQSETTSILWSAPNNEEKIRDFIRNFDGGNGVSPITVDFDIPSEYLI